MPAITHTAVGDMGKSFEDRWNERRRRCGSGDDPEEMVRCGTVLLPREAAPCLTFDEAARPRLIWSVFGRPGDWSAADRARLAPFRMIGSDGAGNPICVEVESGAVWLLDHEDRFRTRQFVNSGVRQLAECLLAYFGEDKPTRFRRAAREVDPAALSAGAFWWDAANMIGDN